MSKKEKAKCKFCEQAKVIKARGYCGSCYQRWQKTGSFEYQRKGIVNICTVADCDRNVVSHGLCDKHRKNFERNGHLNSLRPKDWGTREKHALYSTWNHLVRFRKAQLCKAWKDDFWQFVKDVTLRPSEHHYFRPIDGDVLLSPQNWHWVERVSTNSEESKKYIRQWAVIDRKENPRKYREQHLQKYYGITLKEFEQMRKAQKNKCAICRKKETSIDPKSRKIRELAVDHCHKKGHVRALLCSRCNRGLGFFREDIKILERAITYLKE